MSVQARSLEVQRQHQTQVSSLESRLEAKTIQLVRLEAELDSKAKGLVRVESELARLKETSALAGKPSVSPNPRAVASEALRVDVNEGKVGFVFGMTELV